MSDSAIPWTVAYQAPQSMEFSRQELKNTKNNSPREEIKVELETLRLGNQTSLKSKKVQYLKEIYPTDTMREVAGWK